MGTDAPMAMATETQILTLTQWLSPAYPVGAFAYSHGLEAAAEQGWVTDAASLKGWLVDVLENGAGQADARVIAAAWRAESPRAIAEIDATTRAFAASKERMQETTQLGSNFATITQTIWGGDLSLLCYPVALGVAAARADLPLALTQIMYLQALLSNLIAAGQRLLPVGQTEGQRILYSLSANLSVIATDAADGDLTRLTATAFLTDIASMKHETQYARIFRT